MAGTHLSGPLTVGGLLVPSGFQPAPGLRAGVVPTAKFLYVCSAGNINSVNGDGSAPDKPLAAVGGTSGAIAKLGTRANRGDVIWVLPGHVESVNAADYFGSTSTASGYSIIGLGLGTQRPAFNWTAAASTWLINQAGVEIYNCILNFAVTAATVVVTPITISAANCKITGCYINWGASTTIGCGSTLGAIALTTTADYFEFSNNYCNNLDVAGTNCLALLSCNGADFLKITGNRIFGSTTSTTVGPVHFLTTLSSDIEISGNYIENLITSSTIAISSAISGVTGMVTYNQLRVNSGIQPITVSANMSTTLYQNFASNTVNKNGALVVGAGTSA